MGNTCVSSSYRRTLAEIKRGKKNQPLCGPRREEEEVLNFKRWGGKEDNCCYIKALPSQGRCVLRGGITVPWPLRLATDDIRIKPSQGTSLSKEETRTSNNVVSIHTQKIMRKETTEAIAVRSSRKRGEANQYGEPQVQQVVVVRRLEKSMNWPTPPPRAIFLKKLKSHVPSL